MNPPPALYGAMNRERKPFTYTPGGLDLSEIKSERMAKRLMRNAMNQGVPDTPAQSIKPPPASNIPVAIPNFNCLPVQVFPSFQLPANPKSLLRTRSNPDGSSEPIYKPAQSIANNKSSSSSNSNKPCLIPTTTSHHNKTSLTNNNHIVSKNQNHDNVINYSGALENGAISKSQLNFEANDLHNVPQKVIQGIKPNKGDCYNSFPHLSDSISPSNVAVQNNNKIDTLNSFHNEKSNNCLFDTSDEYNNDSLSLPKISYEAEYLSVLSDDTQKLKELTTKPTDNESLFPSIDKDKSLLNETYFNTSKEKVNQVESNNENILPTNNDENQSTLLSPEIYYEAENLMPETEPLINFELLQSFKQNEINTQPNNKDVLLSSSLKDDSSYDHEQKEVKTVKKQSEKKIKENEVESQNGDTEAEIVVKLPSKKTEAKTETQVEVEKKVLPDGTVEEVTKTTTKTTINGKTETKITTETKTIPKDEEIEEEYEEEEEDEAEENSDVVVMNNETNKTEVHKTEQKKPETETTNEVSKHTEENATKTDHIVTKEEKSETSITKKVVIQSESQDSEEEEIVEEEVLEEESEVEPDVEEVIVIKSKQEPQKVDEKEEEEDTSDKKNKVASTENEEGEEIEEDVQENEKCEDNKDLDSIKDDDEKIVEVKTEAEDLEQESKDDAVAIKTEDEIENDEEQEEEEEKEKEEEESEEQNLETKPEKEINVDEEETEEAFEEAEDKETVTEEPQRSNDQNENEMVSNTAEKTEEIVEKIIPIQQECKKEETELNHLTKETKPLPSSLKDILREPSVPLEKVEEVEIKPIGPTQEIIKKSHTEIITTKTDKPSGALSTQTEYNVIENIVTVNRTTKTLDHAYEQAAAESSIPIIRSYIPPYETSTQPKSYQPNYSISPETERRHSLLLDRISVERQVPIDTYQNNLYSNNQSQSYQETQYMFEPQSEILTESNVKPSTINKNQQWYQQTKKDNFISSNVSSTPTYEWTPPQQQTVPRPQQQQPAYQPQYTPEPQYQSSYIENVTRDSYKTVIDKPNVTPYTSKPSWVNSTYDSKPTLHSQSDQYSSFKNQSTETYQTSSQPYNTSYVPPPWEQDSGYITENQNQNLYQPPNLNTFTPNPTQSPWQTTPEASKFTKPKPTSYTPPAPNQSFVKHVITVEPPKLPGRKTYYSEYERRYISVPESTYIPTETKYQAQPDPSPAYYYDNNEPAEIVEPQWRKELREFTEKTQTTTQINESSVRPPWEADPKYGNSPSVEPNPTWSQTLRPQSWRERSYEPEYTGAKEWPKTNTLGRGRPQSSYVKNNMDRIPERTRGVSVDRYNPNSYQSPIIGEHPPVQSQTLDPSIHPKPHYNPNVPGYHTRASVEPREQTIYPQQRLWGDSRATPVQSRSFKYLQWITGTED